MSLQHLEYVSYIAQDGKEYPIYGGRRALLSLTNFGMAPLTYLQDRGAFQNGVTVRDYRLQPRSIDLFPFERGCKRQDFWDSLGTLSDSVRPNRGLPGTVGKILVVLPDFSQREIDALIVDSPVGSWDYQGSLQTSDMRESLRFFCPDPVWRDPTAATEDFTVNVSADSCLPQCMPFCISATGIISDTLDITYTGTWKTYPTITIIGGLAFPVISNLTTGQTIELDYTISIGETVTIALSEQIDTITNNFGQNLIGTVKDQNDLSTFSIEVDPIAPGGVNTIQVIGSGATGGATGITVSYQTRYLGVPK